MALDQTTTIDSIEVVTGGVVQVRQTTVITDNGVELARKAHRYTLEPGQNIADQPANVQAICVAAWTPEVVTAYQALLAQT